MGNRAFAEQHVKPKLRPYQKLIVTPGLYGNDSAPAAEQMLQDDRLTAKLEAYWNWSVADETVIGLAPYHWGDSDVKNKGHMCYNRSKNSGPCGRPGELFGLGAQHYPQLVARMREIGVIIRGNNPAPKPAPKYEPTKKCECLEATKYVCVEATKKCELSKHGLETKLKCGEACGKPKPKPPAPAPVAAKYVCSKAAKTCVESREGKLSRAVCEKECK